MTPEEQVEAVTAKLAGERYGVKEIRGRFHVWDFEKARIESAERFWYDRHRAQEEADLLNDGYPF